MTDQIFTIYRATNIINSKCYVGFDSDWPNRRNDHSRGQSATPYFRNAIKKYGVDNFVWDILYQSKDRDHTLRVMEPHFIKENNSYRYWKNGGYNLTLGGEGTMGVVVSKSERVKRSERAKKQFSTPEARAEQSERSKIHWNDPEARAKQSELFKIIRGTPEARARQSEYVRNNNPMKNPETVAKKLETTRRNKLLKQGIAL